MIYYEETIWSMIYLFERYAEDLNTYFRWNFPMKTKR
jgi:hypothetical protein